LDKLVPFLVIFKDAVVSVGRWIEHHSNFVSAAATVVIAAFTLTLWCATRKLWKVSQEQSRHMETSIAAAEKAADAAKDSAEALPAIERAYLFVKVVLEIPDPRQVIKIGTKDMPGANRVKVTITNHGKTPAILNRITIRENDFFKAKFDLIMPFGTELIDSGKHRIKFATFIIHGDEEWENIVSDRIKLICEGIIQYTDVWVISHDVIGFCWQYNDLFKTFNPCDDLTRNYRIQDKEKK